MKAKAFLPHKGNGPMVEKIRLQQLRVGEVLESVMDKMDDPAEWKRKWRNLWFHVDGRSWFGTCVFNTAQEAEESAIKQITMSEISFIEYQDENGARQLGIPLLLWSKISHAIPMPVK